MNENPIPVSLEAGCDGLAQLFDKWAASSDQGTREVTAAESAAAYNACRRAISRTWREAADLLRKVVDQSRPTPEGFQALTLAESNAVANGEGWPPEHFEHVDADEIADRSVHQ